MTPGSGTFRKTAQAGLPLTDLSGGHLISEPINPRTRVKSVAISSRETPGGHASLARNNFFLLRGTGGNRDPSVRAMGEFREPRNLDL